MTRPTKPHEIIASPPPTVERTNLAAILVVNFEWLRIMLQLPKGARIEAVQSPIEQPGIVLLRIRGAGWPCEEGEVIQRTSSHTTCTRLDDGRELAPVIDWGLPPAPQPHQA